MAKKSSDDVIGRYELKRLPTARLSSIDVCEVGRHRHYVHAFLEVDVTDARGAIHAWRARTGNKLSFTAWFIKCAAQAVSEHPQAHAVRRGRRSVVVFEDTDFTVLVERALGAERVPLPIVVRRANSKTLTEIHDEIRSAQVIDTTFLSDRASEHKQNSSCVREKWNLPEHYFLVVTRLAKEKNLKRLLAAYKEYVIRFGGELDPWKLIICGTGPEEEKLRGHIMDMPEQIRKKIFLYGYVKQPDIIDFYSCASCLVLPSWCETWGLVVNEAMACSLPVIISNKAGCSFDLVRNDFNGWVFDPFNVSKLTSLMTKMTKLNESARAEMGLRGREIISTWGLDRYCQGVMESARIAYDHRNQ